MDIQWPLVLFTLLSGTGASIALFLGVQILTEKSARLVRPAAITALVFLVVGGLCSAAHLAHPLRAMAVAAHPGAGIFLEVCLLGLVAVLLVCLLLAARSQKEGALKGLAAAAIVAGAALAFFSGASYMMPAHPVWDTVLLPLCYLATALTAGGACFGLMAALKGGEPATSAVFVLEGVLGVAALVCVGAYGAVSGLFATEFAGYVWAVLALSGALPAVVGFVCVRKPLPAALAVAGVAALVGGGLVRVLMWLTMYWGVAATSVVFM